MTLLERYDFVPLYNPLRVFDSHMQHTFFLLVCQHCTFSSRVSCVAKPHQCHLVGAIVTHTTRFYVQTRYTPVQACYMCHFKHQRVPDCTLGASRGLGGDSSGW